MKINGVAILAFLWDLLRILCMSFFIAAINFCWHRLEEIKTEVEALPYINLAFTSFACLLIVSFIQSKK